MRTLLLVRNGVSHDARVLRAARVAERELGGGALVVGVATASAPAGQTTVEGVRVLRLPARRRSAPTPKGVGVPNTSVPTHPPSSPSGRMTWRARARRVFSGASFAWRALMVARRERPALVHANDWNTMWCALAIKLTCRARVVYDSHELWAERNGRWERRPWLLASEALFVRAADAVITASPGYADALAERYRIARPAVVRNIPEVRRCDPNPVPLTGRPTLKTPGSPALVVYVGGLMPGRGLEQMIDALALLPGVRLRTIGAGSERYRASLIARAAAHGAADRVELRAPVPPAEVTSALASAAVGLCLIQPICRSYELCLPNKLFEYAAAGLPMLASDVPVIAALVRGEGLGEVVPNGDPRAIAASLERLLAPGGRRLAAERARAFTEAHDWPREASVLARAYGRADRRSAASASTLVNSAPGAAIR